MTTRVKNDGCSVSILFGCPSDRFAPVVAVVQLKTVT